MSFYDNIFESSLNRGNSKIGVQNHNSHKNKNSNPIETMSIADCVVLGVRSCYSHIEYENLIVTIQDSQSLFEKTKKCACVQSHKIKCTGANYYLI
jgi:hypothetical protein